MRLIGLLSAGVAAAALLSGCLDSDREAFTATISGTVSGLSGAVTVALNDGESRQLTENGSFGFSTRLSPGKQYSVTITSQPASQTCAVANGSGTVQLESVSDVAVTCTTHTHTVGGNISGLIGSLTLSNGVDTLTTSTDGPFVFDTPVAEGTDYAVSVLTQPDIQTCTVSNGTGTVGAVDVSNVTVVCSTRTFSVGGSVSGLAGEVVLQNNGGDAITLDSDGSFEFPAPVAQGSPFSVTVQTQPATQTCTVSNGTGTVGDSDITNVAVTCSTNSYAVGGTVSGLSGSVTLQNNGGDDLAINSDGTFTFPTPVAQGGSYAVTVLTQPDSMTCTVSNGAGTVGGSDITNVVVTCTYSSTTLSVTSQARIAVHYIPATLTITNTGSASAFNVSIALPPGWIAVTHTSNCGAALASGSSCTISLSSTVPYVAQDGIEITADNVTSPPTAAIAFTLEGYLVFSVDAVNSATVIDDVTYSAIWSSSSATTNATGLVDGAGNTAAIIAADGSAAAAANTCATSTNGGATAGSWYLPAVCQLTNAGGWAGCSTGTPNVWNNLLRMGFTPDLVSMILWTSTENPQDGTEAFYTLMYQNDPSERDTTKTAPLSVRCARSMSY